MKGLPGLQHIALGVEIASSAAIPIYVGFKIDQHTGQTPLLTILGLLLGLGGTIALLLRAKKIFDKDDGNQ